MPKYGQKRPKKWQKRPKKAAKRGKKKICDSSPLFWGKKFDFSAVFSLPSEFVFFQKIKNRVRFGRKIDVSGKQIRLGNFVFGQITENKLLFGFLDVFEISNVSHASMGQSFLLRLRPIPWTYRVIRMDKWGHRSIFVVFFFFFSFFFVFFFFFFCVFSFVALRGTVSAF